MKAWGANSVLLLLPTIWWLDALKRREKIVRENAFKQKKKKPGLKFKPGLALIDLRTSGPWISAIKLVEKYETANWSLRQGDEEVNKGIKQKIYI